MKGVEGRLSSSEVATSKDDVVQIGHRMQVDVLLNDHTCCRASFIVTKAKRTTDLPQLTGQGSHSQSKLSEGHLTAFTLPGKYPALAWDLFLGLTGSHKSLVYTPQSQ